MKKLFTIIGLIVLIGSTVFISEAKAQPLPMSDDFLVTETTASKQEAPAMAMDPEGNFVVAWTDWCRPGSGMSCAAVSAQRFNISGERQGSQIYVDTTSGYKKVSADVAMNSHGQFVVVWMYYYPTHSVWARVYARDGKPITGKIRVDTYADPAQHPMAAPKVAMDDTGRFTVVWHSPSGGWDVYARRFDADGNALDEEEFRVNSITEGSQLKPSVACDPEGNFVVAWMKSGPRPPIVYFSRFNSEGIALDTSDIYVGKWSTWSSNLEVAINSSGQFVVAWTHENDSSNWGIMARCFDFNKGGSASSIGGAFWVNTYREYRQSAPDIAIDNFGNFIISWVSHNQTNVYAQAYKIEGNNVIPVGGEFPVNQYTCSYQSKPAVGMDNHGNFVIAWCDHSFCRGDRNTRGDIYARRFIFSEAVPPTSTIQTSPAANENGWNKEDVTVSITAQDEEDGSGVAMTEYSLDGGQTWLQYTESFTISDEGATTVLTRSTDNAGNVEDPPVSVEVKIDKTPPEISGAVTTSPNENGWYNLDVTVHFAASDNISGLATEAEWDVDISSEGAGQSITGTATDMAGNSNSTTVSGINIDKTQPAITILVPEATDYPHSDMITLEFSAADDTSGLASLTAELDGEEATSSQSVDLFFLSLGEHTLTVNAGDNAGNTAEESATFTVVATAGSILNSVEHAFELGLIDSDGIKNSLISKLEAALKSIDKGKSKTAENQLNAFINQVEAQKGKHITADAADILIADAQYMIDHLP